MIPIGGGGGRVCLRNISAQTGDRRHTHSFAIVINHHARPANSVVLSGRGETRIPMKFVGCEEGATQCSFLTSARPLLLPLT